MLLTLFMNQSSVLNAMIFLGLIALQGTAQTVLGSQASTGNFLLDSVLANAGIGTILFLIWHLTFKRTQKQFDFALKQNQEQYQTMLDQIDKQHKESLEQNQKTIDRMIEMMRKDMEYKQLLTGILSEMKNSINHLE